MVIELTLGVSKEDSQFANLSDRHNRRWDQIAKEYHQATTNVPLADPFDPPQSGTQPGSA